MHGQELVKMCQKVEWDGINRLAELAGIFESFPNTNVNNLTNAHTWLLQCCAAWDYNEHNPIKHDVNKFEKLLLLIGIDPHVAKDLFTYILPDDYKHHQVSIPFDPMKKRSIIPAIDYNLVVLTGFTTDGGFRKAKEYISFLSLVLNRSVDKYRKAFGKFWMPEERRTVFGGTVKDPRHLKNIINDTKQFLAVYLISIDFEKLSQLDKYQLWAQLWYEYTHLGYK